MTVISVCPTPPLGQVQDNESQPGDSLRGRE